MPLIDPPLTPRPKLKLSRLRDIGWSVWDPIGLLEPGQNWTDEDFLTFADEYDSYLMWAAGLLKRGAQDADVANYLVQAEVQYMGLVGQGAMERAAQVVTAIKADKELWTNPK